MSDNDLHKIPNSDTISKGIDKPVTINPNVTVSPPPAPSGSSGSNGSKE